jgi:hypothetical protein
MCDLEQARLRNLIIKITHAVIEDKLDLNINFEDGDVFKKLYFKRSDLEIHRKDIFKNNFILEEIKEKVNLYNKKYQESFKYNEEERFKNLYFELDSYFKTHNSDEMKFKQNIKEANDIATRLHWKYLPIYVEQFIVNNGVLPEDQLGYFYNHFHAIEDLYRYIFTDNKIDWKSIDGDINLDKEMVFKVYTTRWGHYDNYTIKRTLNGWFVEHLMANNGDSDKNGDGALLEKLDHDSVAYPTEGVKYALEILWNEADTTEMTVEELQKRLNEIALWIEQVEKVTHEYQPNWCGYY